mgnify:FL=1
MKDDKHYICTGGCGGVSETPGVCQAKDCPDHGQPLKDCGCADGKHSELEKENE